MSAVRRRKQKEKAPPPVETLTVTFSKQELQDILRAWSEYRVDCGNPVDEAFGKKMPAIVQRFREDLKAWFSSKEFAITGSVYGFQQLCEFCNRITQKDWEFRKTAAWRMGERRERGPLSGVGARLSRLLAENEVYKARRAGHSMDDEPADGGI